VAAAPDYTWGRFLVMATTALLPVICINLLGVRWRTFWRVSEVSEASVTQRVWRLCADILEAL
jgi:hypothetical protein